MNINRCELSGHVTRDGDLKATTGGTSVLAFGLAFNDRKRNTQTGEWEDVPNFIDCVIFGKYAESMEPYITKGRHVYVAGKLRYSSWEKDGGKRSKIELVVDTLDLASAPKQTKQAAPYQPAQPVYNAPAPAPAQPVYNAPVQPLPTQDDLYDEDIPF